MKSFLIILVIAVLVSSTFDIQVYAKHAHDARSNSTSGGMPSLPSQLQPLLSSPGSDPHSGHTKPLSNLTERGNITSFVEQCFTNNTGSVLNITVNNASEIIDHCFHQYELGHINKVTHHHSTATSNTLGPGTLLAPGQLIVASMKHPPMKHSAAYNIGYN
jgi:hypothetical protein